MQAKHLLNPELQKVLSHVYQSRLPGSLSRRVLAVTLAFTKASEEFEAARGDLQKAHGEKDANGNLVQIDGRVNILPDNIDTFNAQFMSLLETEYPVKRLDVEDLEDMPSISAAEIKLLQDAGLVRA